MSKTEKVLFQGLVLCLLFFVGMITGALIIGTEESNLYRESIGWSYCIEKNMSFVRYDDRFNYMYCGEEVKVCEVNGELNNCRQEIKEHSYKYDFKFENKE